MIKWLKRLGYLMAGLIVVIILLVNLSMRMMRYSDADIQAFFKESEVEVLIKNASINNLQVRVVSEESGQSDSLLILFIHGAPGSWDAYKEYMVDPSLYEHARLVALDRPGYGGSDENSMASIVDQCEIIDKVLGLFEYKSVILVGHSYGAPIAGYAALNKALKVKSSLMIAPLLDPDHEPIFWYSYLAYWRLTSWLLPRELRVAGVEKFHHAEALKVIENKWKDIHSKVIYIHGMKDALAPPQENILFAEKHIPSQFLEMIIFEDNGHLLIWEKFDEIKGILIKEMAR